MSGNAPLQSPRILRLFGRPGVPNLDARDCLRAHTEPFRDVFLAIPGVGHRLVAVDRMLSVCSPTAT